MRAIFISSFIYLFWVISLFRYKLLTTGFMVDNFVYDIDTNEGCWLHSCKASIIAYLKTLPSFITNCTSSSTAMFSSGLPLTAIISAKKPLLIWPS